MKRKTALFLAVIMAATMTACGSKTTSSEQDIEDRLNRIDSMSDEEAEREIERGLEGLDEDYSEDTAAEETEPHGVDWSKFEPMDVIKTDCNTSMVQVGDIVIHYPARLSDVIEEISKSSLEWESDYNPDKLVPFHDYDDNGNFKFTFVGDKKGELLFECGEKQITLEYMNLSPEQETVSLKDTYVTKVDVGLSLDNTLKYGGAGKGYPEKVFGGVYLYPGYGKDMITDDNTLNDCYVKYAPTYTELTNELKEKGIEYNEDGGSTTICITFGAPFYKEIEFPEVDTKIEFRDTYKYEFNTDNSVCTHYGIGAFLYFSRDSYDKNEYYDQAFSDIPKFGE